MPGVPGPMAYDIAGGIIVGTMITLLFTFALYLAASRQIGPILLFCFSTQQTFWRLCAKRWRIFTQMPGELDR